jgi:hypothetical protein
MEGPNMSFAESSLRDPAVRRRVEDFVSRYQQGAPADGIDEQEALEHHQRLASESSPEQYEQAARAAFSRLGPEERAQLSQQFQAAAQACGLDTEGVLGGAVGEMAEPDKLARLAGQFQRQQPARLGELLGGGSPGGGSTLAGSVVRASLGGIAAMLADQKLSSAR